MCTWDGLNYYGIADLYKIGLRLVIIIKNSDINRRDMVEGQFELSDDLRLKIEARAAS